MTPSNRSDELESPKIRLAILDGSKSPMVAQVVLTEMKNGEINLSVSGDGPQANRVAHAVQEVAAEVQTIARPLAEQIMHMHQAISIRLTGDGFQVRDLPSGDIQLSYEINLKTGRVVGRQSALHDLAGLDVGLRGRLDAAMRSAFVKGVMDLATEIQSLTADGDHIGAAQALKAGRERIVLSGIPPKELHDALQTISVAGLDADIENFVREFRMEIAAKRNEYDVAEGDASALLSTIGADQAKHASLENVIAVASARRGEIETALSIWRKIMMAPEILDPDLRGWIMRNFSMTPLVPLGEAIRAARQAVDAFLEAGDKFEAASSLMHLSRLLENENPTTAIEQLNDMLTIINQDGLIGSDLRAAIYHSRGMRFQALRAHSQALESALQAVELRRGVLGVESELISSLHLAIMEAKAVGNHEFAEKLNAEALQLETAASSVHFALARRIEGLMAKFDRETADAILKDVRAHGDPVLIAGAVVVTTTADPTLDTTARLRQLEVMLRSLKSEKKYNPARHVVLTAIASVLRTDGQFTRSIKWLQDTLQIHPLDLTTRDMLLDSLWRAEQWGDAAIFLKAQIELHGEAPGLLFAYGRSLFESGDVSEAIPILSKGIQLSKNNESMRNTIVALRDRALELGGTIVPQTPAVSGQQPVIRDELEQALKEFAVFIGAEKRMGFWTRSTPSSDYAWVQRPERRAQDLLHTFLKARFQKRISIFEELGTGAGRLDLLLKLDGGLSIVIELKMCGFGYPSEYAAAGEDQIRHYMQNRSCHLGYLVVHDARLDKFGAALIKNLDQSNDTVCEIFVDVRPRVSSRTNANRSANPSNVYVEP